MADESREIEAILGPYRGQRLTVSAADADAAINDHWARDPFAAPEDPPHDPLSEEERTAALASAQAWADMQQAIAAGEPPEVNPPPEEGGTRAMHAAPGRGYKTRGR